jgi:alanyl-tRNA synthetase
VTSKEIRAKFLDYFAGNDHTLVQSSSLVPEKDPTLLFVNAGMVQFKNLFTGIEKRDYARATTCQKCVRAGGKHNDLDNIGKTLRHHTFFEMLGNFSFGNYFKKEAIGYAWQFLKGELSLDEKRMWVTVFREDSEAEAIWRSMGVNPDRIVKLGEKDNFWAMGDEGPCGPCSEIIYDLGPEVGCRLPTCAVGCDCDRYLEIWNLVFMEFERSREGEMRKLPRPSIDTGMGLERVTSVMQGKIGNYDTDLFVPIMKKLEDISGCLYGDKDEIDVAMRVIVDHARGATFIINDGVLPSKEGRGYVLRRIMRRALRYGKKIGIEKEFLHELAGTVVDIMGDVYPEIRQNHSYISRVLKGEEDRFTETLGVGMRVYDEIIEEVKKKGRKVIPGDLVYKLYDTFGFPIDITVEIAEEDGLSVDMEGFDAALEEQKVRSRASSRIKGDTLAEGHAAVIKENLKNTFVGYETLEADAEITCILKDEEIVGQIGEGEEAELFFDVTPFYAESGGQVEDEGSLSSSTAEARVSGVGKVKEDLFTHHVKVGKGVLRKGGKVHLSVDSLRRSGTARNHTATHLLQYALRTVLGDHVKQSGSSVEPERLRFDFTHFQGLDEAEIVRVEDIVNEKIMACMDVTTLIRQREEAIREGATALFEEKYGETVRVLKIGDFSTELCGGTHVGNTGEIGSFYVTSEGSLAYGVRRIEAVTGMGALQLKRRMDGLIKSVAKTLNVERERIQEKAEALLEELKQSERELGKLKGEMTLSGVDEAVKEAGEKNGIKIVTMFVPGASAEDLRKVTDMVRNKAKSCIAVVGSRDEAKGTLVVAVTKDLQGRYHSGKIVKALAERYGGRGGGGPQIAQGGIGGDRVVEALRGAGEVI